MNDPDRTAMWPVTIGDDLPERLWSADGFAREEDNQSGDPMDRLVSMGFIIGTLKRRWLTWCTIAILGLVIGTGLHAEKAPLYQASTTLLLSYDANTDPSTAIATDVALAQSTAVGEAVIRQLGLPGSVSTFLGSYVASTSSDQVLTITASAPTSDQAVQRATAIATQFLDLLAKYAQIEQQQLETSLNRQIQLAKQSYESITKQVKQVAAQPSSTTQQQQLKVLQAQQQQAGISLTQTQQDVVGTLISSRVSTQTEIKDSRVINEAEPLHQSKIKPLLLYLGGGLFGGLVIGIGIVAVGALMSSRLRRRDDIAYALGVPVGLSVGQLRGSRMPSLRGHSGQRERDINRVIDHLMKILSTASYGEKIAFAVVAVDDAQTVAELAVALAASCAKQQQRVLLADLSEGRYAARMLGLSQHGLSKASFDGTSFRAIVPPAHDVTPVGPFRGGAGAKARDHVADVALAEAGRTADIILTLTTLDPATGGDHLRTWAATAVAVVTAGGATSERIRAVGDMVKAAGLRLDSAVVIGADTSDTSLGIGTVD